MAHFENGAPGVRKTNNNGPRPSKYLKASRMPALALSVGLMGACSPYVFKAETDAFGKAVTSMSGSIDQMVVDLSDNEVEIGKMRAFPSGSSGPRLSAACSTRDPGKDSCGIVVDNRRVDKFEEAHVAQFVKDLKDLKNLAAYAKALASISNAKDRAELDAATEKLAVSLGTFSADLAPLVGAGTRLVGLTVGTVMDYRRVTQMRRSVVRIDPLLKAAAPRLKQGLTALANIHYSSELRKYRQLQVTLRHTRTETLRKDMIDDLLDGAAKLRGLQKFKPESLVDRLVKSHGALTKALVESKPDAAQLLALLEDFQKAAEDLRAAVDAE